MLKILNAVTVWCNWWGITNPNKAGKMDRKRTGAFQRPKWSVNHKTYSVPITSRIPWHYRTAIVLVRMKHDLNRNAIQSAETQNKSTDKQYKASYIVSHSNPRPRTWPEKNQVQHIPIRPIIYCASKRLCRDDKLTAPFPKDITLGMQFAKHSWGNVACCKFLLESKFCKIQFKKNLICPWPVFTTHSEVSWDFFQMELLIQPGSSLKKPLKSLLLKVPMLWTAAVMSREILWEDPLAVYPALPSAASCFSRHPERQGPSWGASACLLTPLSQTGLGEGLRMEYSAKQSLDPKTITDVSSNYAKQMLFPAPVSAGSPLVTHKASLSPVSSPLCSDLCCSAALHSWWKFWCLFKA